MKKVYEEVKIEITEFEALDVLASSPDYTDNELPSIGWEEWE